MKVDGKKERPRNVFYVHEERRFFLSANVDDTKKAGKKRKTRHMWKSRKRKNRIIIKTNRNDNINLKYD